MVEAWFKKDGYDVKVTPHSNTYTATTTFSLPPLTSGSGVLVGAATTQTLTGKTIDGDDNTVQDLALTSIKTVLGDANEIVRRDSTGAVVSGPGTISDTGALNNITNIDVRDDSDLSAAASPMVRLENRNDVAASHPHIEFRRARASNANLANGDEIGGLDFHPRHGGTSLAAAHIHGEYTGDGTTRLADLVFETSNAGAPAERMRLKANGDLNLTGLTASRVLVTDADKDLVSSAVTATEVGYLSGVTSTVVGTTDSQVITNKDYDGGTASDTSRLTLPKDTYANLSALTRKEGTLLYATDLDQVFYDDGSVLTPVGSGTGQGEKTYIDNPSAASAITGWTAVGDLAVARTTTAAELPREYTTGTGIKITADADVQSTADYIYYDFTLDDVDLNKKLKIQWSQKTTGSYNAGDLAVVITTQADRTTALHTPVTTAIPDADGVFTTTFDSGSTATLSLVIRATTDMTTDAGIVISDVVVGPGTVEQVAGPGPWESWTPTYAGLGTPTSVQLFRRRNGENYEVIGSLVTGTTTATTSAIILPNGSTINSADLGTANVNLGQADRATTGNNLSTAGLNPIIFWDGSTTDRVFFSIASTASGFTKVNGSTAFGTGELLSIRFSYPAGELAGQTINMGAGAQVEYAFNTSGVTAAGGSDTTSFGYGPAGAAIGNIASTTANSTTFMYCRFQNPIQATDTLTLECDEGTSGARWVPMDTLGSIQGRMNQGTSIYGVSLGIVNSTDVVVSFGNKGRTSNNATYAGDGATWAGASTYRWRVKKASPSAPVGFGMANSNESGLVAPRKGQYDLTVTGTNWTTVRAVGIYYQDQSGAHRLKCNIFGSLSATALTFTGTVDGVTFKNVANYQQAISGALTEAGVDTRAVKSSYVNPNASTFYVESASNFNRIGVSFDVELESKPTWA